MINAVLERLAFVLLAQLDDLRKRNEGATMIEYSILIGLVSVVLVATILLVSNQLVLLWNGVESVLQTAVDALP